jgi:hypothetical protein
MREETKKALDEYKKAKNKANELLGCFVQYDSAKPISNISVDTDAVADALREEKEALIKYKTLLYTDMGWSQEKIDDWLIRAGLKKEE